MCYTTVSYQTVRNLSLFLPFFAPVFWCVFTRTTYRSSSHDSTTECTMSMWNMINSHFFDSAVPSSLYNARKRFYIGIRKLNLPATGETWRWKAFRERKRRENSEGIKSFPHNTEQTLVRATTKRGKIERKFNTPKTYSYDNSMENWVLRSDAYNHHVIELANVNFPHRSLQQMHD